MIVNASKNIPNSERQRIIAAKVRAAMACFGRAVCRWLNLNRGANHIHLEPRQNNA